MGISPYPDTYVYEEEMFSAMMDASMAGAFMFAFMLILLFSLACTVVCYVFQSLGMHTIGNRRKIQHSWLVWVPFGNMWILGSISDQYQYLVKGKVKNRRKTLLGLNIGCVASYLLAVLCEFVGILNPDVVLFIIGYLLGMLGYAVTVIILTVFQYMAYYDLYRSCKPDDSVLFLVLSIVFPITLPIFVFICRKKDLGMPPRKQPVQPMGVPVQPMVAPVQPMAAPVQPMGVPMQPMAAPVQPQQAEEEEETETEAEEGFAQPEEFEE